MFHLKYAECTFVCCLPLMTGVAIKLRDQKITEKSPGSADLSSEGRVEPFLMRESYLSFYSAQDYNACSSHPLTLYGLHRHQR